MLPGLPYNTYLSVAIKVKCQSNETVSTTKFIKVKISDLAPDSIGITIKDNNDKTIDESNPLSLLDGYTLSRVNLQADVQLLPDGYSSDQKYDGLYF